MKVKKSIPAARSRLHRDVAAFIAALEDPRCRAVPMAMTYRSRHNGTHVDMSNANERNFGGLGDESQRRSDPDMNASEDYWAMITISATEHCQVDGDFTQYLHCLSCQLSRQSAYSPPQPALPLYEVGHMVVRTFVLPTNPRVSGQRSLSVATVTCVASSSSQRHRPSPVMAGPKRCDP